MFDQFLKNRRARQQVNQAWLTWVASVRSRIYMPYPHAELSISTDNPAMRRHWESARNRALSQLRRTLPYEEFQDAWASAESRTTEQLAPRLVAA